MIQAEKRREWGRGDYRPSNGLSTHLSGGRKKDKKNEEKKEREEGREGGKKEMEERKGGREGKHVNYSSLD